MVIAQEEDGECGLPPIEDSEPIKNLEPLTIHPRMEYKVQESTGVTAAPCLPC